VQSITFHKRKPASQNRDKGGENNEKEALFALYFGNHYYWFAGCILYGPKNTG
jgi:hypothetical protein